MGWLFTVFGGGPRAGESDAKDARPPRFCARTTVAALCFTLSCVLVAHAAPQAKPSTSSVNKQKSSRKDTPAWSAVDLNNASENELDSLPGVGPATAKKIIDQRPYQSVEDSAKVGVAAKEIERLRPLVTAGTAAAPSAGRFVPKESAARTPTNPASTGPAERANSAKTTAPPPAGSKMVWVNTETKVYHREGDRWYGKTKHGSYMTESAAQQAGYRAAKR